MIVRNFTDYDVARLFEQSVAGFDTEGLIVEVKYCPRHSQRLASGTYYRRTAGSPNGRLIRLRINRYNTYPVRVYFKTSEYYRRKDSQGREIVYQKLIACNLASPQHLLLATFLHEFSHYLDHMEGRNGRYKQTKADKFALQKLRELGIVRS